MTQKYDPSIKADVTSPRPAGPPRAEMHRGAMLVYAQWIKRYFWLVLIAAALLSFAAFERASHLKIATNLEALMPDGVASVENLHDVLEKTGSFASAMVVITSPDPDAALRFAGAMQRHVMENFEWVGAANYYEDLAILEQHKLLYMDTDELTELRDWARERTAYERQQRLSELAGSQVNIRLRSEPQYSATTAPPDLSQIIDNYEQRQGPITRQQERRFFQSDDGEVTIMVVWPRRADTGLGMSRRMVTDLQTAAVSIDPSNFHPDMQVGVGGRIYNRVVQFDAIMNDVKSSALWSFSLIALLLALYYRSVMHVIYLFIPLVLGILWTMGLAQMVIGGLNLITIFLVLILFGLGIDFGIHNLARYRECRRAGQNVENALFTIFRHTGAASLVAGITTAAGFFSLMLTDFRAFSEFGFIAGSGIVLTFLSMYVVLPALLVTVEKLGLYQAGGNAAQSSTQTYGPFPGARGVVIGTVVILVASIFWAPGISFENDFGKLQAQRSDAHLDIGRNIGRVFPDGTDRAVLIVKTQEEVRAILDYFDAYIAADTETPTIRKVASVYSVLPDPDAQVERLAIIHEIGDLVGDEPIKIEDERLGDGNWQQYLDIEGLTPADLPDGLRRVYTGLEGTDGYLIYIFNSVSMNIAELARAFSDDIREIKVGDKTYYPATEALIFVDMLNLMKGDALKAILFVSGLTFLVTLIFLRSIKDTLMVLSPTIVGMTMLLALMAIFDIKLSIMNMVILPTIIGISVDNGIHIFHRHREENGNVMKTMKTTGAAAGITTLTTMLGFAGMLSASMGGLQSLGLLAVTGFATCLLASWTILPALLQLTDKKA